MSVSKIVFLLVFFFIFLFVITPFFYTQNVKSKKLPPVLPNKVLQPQVPLPQTTPVPPLPTQLPPQPPGAPPLPPQPPGGVVAPVPGPVPIQRNMDLGAIYQYAPQIISTASVVMEYVKFGKVWAFRGPGGESEIKAGLIYQNRIISVLRLDGKTGKPLPIGVNTNLLGNYNLMWLKSNLSNIIFNLKVVGAIEYRAPENCWVIPIAYGGLKVGELKITYDGSYVIPDLIAEEEAKAYSQY